VKGQILQFVLNAQMELKKLLKLAMILTELIKTDAILIVNQFLMDGFALLGEEYAQKIVGMEL